jgi:hypothetical protein
MKLTEEQKDKFRAAGWTILQSGVIYDRDPGDEHVELDRWTAISQTYQALKAQGWIIFQ